MNLNENQTKILLERKKQYGDIKKNMYLIEILYKRVKIKSNKLSKTKINFFRYMFALKAARSLNAKGEYYQDCIDDFINYRYLLLQLDSNVEIYFEYPFAFELNDMDKEITVLVK